MALVRRKFPRDKDAAQSADTSAYCQARAKIPLDVLDKINTHWVERMQNHIPHGALWHGRHVQLVDGTGVSMPDTPVNQARWPQSKNCEPGLRLPRDESCRHLQLSSPGHLSKPLMATAAPTKPSFSKPSKSTLKKGDLLVCDRGFCSFGAIATLLAKRSGLAHAPA